MVFEKNMRNRIFYADRIKSIKDADCSPGLMTGMYAPLLLRLSAISLELKVKASQM